MSDSPSNNLPLYPGLTPISSGNAQTTGLNTAALLSQHNIAPEGTTSSSIPEQEPSFHQLHRSSSRPNTTVSSGSNLLTSGGSSSSLMNLASDITESQFNVVHHISTGEEDFTTTTGNDGDTTNDEGALHHHSFAIETNDDDDEDDDDDDDIDPAISDGARQHSEYSVELEDDDDDDARVQVIVPDGQQHNSLYGQPVQVSLSHHNMALQSGIASSVTGAGYDSPQPLNKQATKFAATPALLPNSHNVLPSSSSQGLTSQRYATSGVITGRVIPADGQDEMKPLSLLVNSSSAGPTDATMQPQRGSSSSSALPTSVVHVAPSHTSPHITPNPNMSTVFGSPHDIPSSAAAALANAVGQTPVSARNLGHHHHHNHNHISAASTTAVAAPSTAAAAATTTAAATAGPVTIIPAHHHGGHHHGPHHHNDGPQQLSSRQHRRYLPQDDQQEFLHVHPEHGLHQTIQSIMVDASLPQRQTQSSGRTAVAVAVDETHQGIAAMNEQRSKPIPTFTRCHLNTNWITDSYVMDSTSASAAAAAAAKLRAGRRQSQVQSQLPSGMTPTSAMATQQEHDEQLTMIYGEDIRNTFSNFSQPKPHIDDSCDIEKQNVALRFLQCLRLRQAFVFTPSIVDRRVFTMDDAVEPFSPVIDGKTITRPVFEDMSTHTETVVETSFNAVHPPSSQNQSTVTSPTAAREAATPTNKSTPKSNLPYTSPFATSLTTTTTTVKTTTNNCVVGNINAELSSDLLNSPDDFIYGFVNGVMHIYRRDVDAVLQHQEQLQKFRDETGSARSVNGFPAASPPFPPRASNANATNNNGNTAKLSKRQQQRQAEENAMAKEKQYEQRYGGYRRDIYWAALHQHHQHESYSLQLEAAKLNENGNGNTDTANNNTSTSTSKPHNKQLDNYQNNYNASLSHQSETQDNNNGAPQLEAKFQRFDEYYDNLFPVPSWIDFCDALAFLLETTADGPCKTWSHSRLEMLETQKSIHSQLNQQLELAQSKAVPHRDFYNVRKVDNHIHHSACMNQKHLLRFIKKKLREPEANTKIVIVRDGAELTLNQVFQSLNLTAYDLNIDTLDMHASSTFQRFDKFNLKYNPIGESRLREIFLKYNNLIQGQYLAEITREVFEDLQINKYQYAEYRVSIYGRDINEWDALADWIIDNKLVSPNARWMIQIPRLYSVYKRTKTIYSLQTMLTNIFLPIFHATLHPHENPKLHQLLSFIVGFDTVDDESVRTSVFDRANPPPQNWTRSDDPHYCSFLYYLYANLRTLNHLRELVGLNTFALRPHGGEAGDIEHMSAAFLLAQGVNHGLTLFKSPPMQYMFYLSQTGLSMSPLSNNLLFLEYSKNPFPRYFARGLNVTLSTDDPLLIHVTKEPLVEEYSVASQVWKLSHIDLCEIARNSVIQSGFQHKHKAHWLGNYYWKRNVEGNDIRCTNVPDIRIQFRWELLYREHLLLTSNAYSHNTVDVSLIDPIV